MVGKKCSRRLEAFQRKMNSLLDEVKSLKMLLSTTRAERGALEAQVQELKANQSKYESVAEAVGGYRRRIRELEEGQEEIKKELEARIAQADSAPSKAVDIVNSYKESFEHQREMVAGILQGCSHTVRELSQLYPNYEIDYSRVPPPDYVVEFGQRFADQLSLEEQAAPVEVESEGSESEEEEEKVEGEDSSE
jgi:seryl-tRNA synthetase